MTSDKRVAARAAVIDRYRRRGRAIAVRLVRGAARRLGVTGLPFQKLIGVAMVEEYAHNRVVGWIAVPPVAPPVRVSLQVNGHEIAATYAESRPPRSVGRRQARGFRFLLWEIWQWVGPDDAITVVADDTRIAIAGHGTEARPKKQGAHTSTELTARMGDGWVFSRVGKFQLSKKLDTHWQQQVITLAGWVRDFMQEQFGYDAFYTYGSLLGAVREGGFMGHDVDLDMGYVSKHTDGARVGPELHDIGLAFIAAGWEVEPFRTHLHVMREVHGGAMRVDLFSHYFDESGSLGFPYGQAGRTHVTADEWRGVREIDFLTGKALVPVTAEPMLTQLYGASWGQPQPGFSWKYDRKEKAEAGLMSRELCEDVYWSDHFTRFGYDDGSSFFEHVAARPDTPDVVVDLGCGDGRDSIAYAGSGRRTYGLDRSAVAVAKATEKAERAGVAELATFVRGDVGERTALDAVLTTARAAAAGGPVLFHLRFLLHVIPLDVQTSLLTWLGEVVGPGDRVAIEFRPTPDKDLVKVHRGHYRRFQDGAAVGAQLRDLGFSVLEESEEGGLSPFAVGPKAEDPVLYRVVAARD